MESRQSPSSNVIFNGIYHAAKEKKSHFLTELRDTDIKNNARIKMLEAVRDDNGILTPSGFLAAEDDRDAVGFLCMHGASLFEIARGAGYGNNERYIQELRHEYNLADYGNTVNFSSFIAYLYNTFLGDKNFKTCIAINFAIVLGAMQAGRFASEELALRELTAIDSEYMLVGLRHLVERINAPNKTKEDNTQDEILLARFNVDSTVIKNITYDIKNLITQAKHLRQLMQEYKFTYEQAYLWSKIEVNNDYEKIMGSIRRNDFQEGDIEELKQKLTEFDADLTEKTDLIDLSNKLILREHYKKPFIDEMSAYASGYFVRHKERANALVAACEKTKNLDKFKRKINYQIQLFTDEKPTASSDMPKHKQLLDNDSQGEYFRIIERHHKKMF